MAYMIKYLSVRTFKTKVVGEDFTKYPRHIGKVWSR